MRDFLRAYWFYIVVVVVLWVGLYLGGRYELVRTPEGFGAMAPALESGKFYLFKQYRGGRLRRGRIVCVRFERLDSSGKVRLEERFARVAGLPGESVRLEKGRLVVNGQSVEEPYLPEPSHEGERERWGELNTVEVLTPRGCVWLLNDNRLVRTDSRIYGAVPLRNVVALLEK